MIDYIFGNYRLTELWGFPLLLFIFIATILYLTLVGPYRERFLGTDTISLKKKSYFLLGMILTALTLGGPLHVIGHHYLFSVHMFEQAILYMVIVPLLLLGVPKQAYTMLVAKPIMKKVVKVLTHPITSILFFNGLFSIYHYPLVFDAVSANHSLFTIFHFVLFIGAILMWLSLLSPIPEINALGELSRIGYIFMSGALITPVCALIIFSSTPMYSTYLNVPQLVRFLPAIEDQRLGGIVMKIVQEGVFISSIAFIFFKWAKKERLKEPDLEKAV